MLNRAMFMKVSSAHQHVELTTAKQTPALTEQVLEKETHELRFGNGLGVTARGSGHGMNGVTCRGG